MGKKFTATQVDIKQRNIEMMAIRLIHESLNANPKALMNLSAKNEMTKSISKVIELNVSMYEMLSKLANESGLVYGDDYDKVEELLAKARGDQ